LVVPCVRYQGSRGGNVGMNTRQSEAEQTSTGTKPSLPLRPEATAFIPSSCSLPLSPGSDPKLCAKINEIVYKGLQSNYIGLPSHTGAMSCSLSLDNHPR